MKLMRQFNLLKVSQPEALIVCLLFFHVISYWINWVSVSYLLDNPIEIISYKSDDPSGMPFGFTSIPLLGVHHFGDFNLYYGWAKISDFNLNFIFNNSLSELNPYLYGGITSNYPPMSILLFEVFTLLNLSATYVIYLSLNLSVITVIIWKLLSGYSIYNKLLIIFVTQLMSLPYLITIDRGNIQLTILLLIFLYYFLNLSNRMRYSTIVILMAASLKIYPILIALLNVNLKNIKKSLIFLFGAIVLNLILFSMLPGPTIPSLKAFVSANAIFTGETTAEIFSGIGLVSLLSRAGLIFFEKSVIITFVNNMMSIPFLGARALWIPGIVYLGVVIFCLRRKKLPAWVNQTLILSTIQMVPPLGFGYVTVWVNLAVILFFYYNLRFSIYQNIFMYKLLVISFIMVSVSHLVAFPLRLSIGQDTFPFNAIISNISMFIFVSICLLVSIEFRIKGRLRN